MATRVSHTVTTVYDVYQRIPKILWIVAILIILSIFNLIFFLLGITIIICHGLLRADLEWNELQVLQQRGKVLEGLIIDVDNSEASNRCTIFYVFNPDPIRTQQQIRSKMTKLIDGYSKRSLLNHKAISCDIILLITSFYNDLEFSIEHESMTGWKMLPATCNELVESRFQIGERIKIIFDEQDKYHMPLLAINGMYQAYYDDIKWYWKTMAFYTVVYIMSFCGYGGMARFLFQISIQADIDVSHRWWNIIFSDLKYAYTEELMNEINQVQQKMSTDVIIDIEEKKNL